MYTRNCRRRSRHPFPVASNARRVCRLCKPFCARRDSALGLSAQTNLTGTNADNRSLRLDRRLILDLMLISFDACAGLAIAIWLFGTPATMGVIALGSFT